jgi:hypothetical protein
LIAVRRATRLWRYSISDRHCRTAGLGTCTVGRFSISESCASFSASLRSLLSFTVFHFHRSSLALATWIGTFIRCARSHTHPAAGQASITTRSGGQRNNSFSSSGALVASLPKLRWPPPVT